MSDSGSLARSRRKTVEQRFEWALFQSRWLMAPFYLGLVVALAALVIVFVAELWRDLVNFGHVMSMSVQDAILMALSLIDVSLVGNLLLIVIFSGYENFVSKIDTGDHEDRPAWMGSVDFAGVKIKLFTSIIAISAIALLKVFIEITEGHRAPDASLPWLIGMHMTFLASGLLLALMDVIRIKAGRRG